LARLPSDVAGTMAEVGLPDGSAETSLLPTVPIGCGVLFRTQALRDVDGGYPKKFLFYGEEYWQTLTMYANGWRLTSSTKLKINHRADKSTANKDRIFYRLARNNAVIWERFAPARYKEQLIYDTQRRYELIADKEGVRGAFDRGLKEALRIEDEPCERIPCIGDFERFALLDRFNDVDAAGKRFALCGTGKFPSLWASTLMHNGAKDVIIYDFNRALTGAHFKEFLVCNPHERSIPIEYDPILGHSSSVDTALWRRKLERETPTREIVNVTP